MGPVTNRLSLTQRLFAASPSVPFPARRWWQPEPTISILWPLTYFSPIQLLSINKAQGNLHFKPCFTKAFHQAEQSCWYSSGSWYSVSDEELIQNSLAAREQHPPPTHLNMPGPQDKALWVSAGVPRESLTSHLPSSLSLALWISDPRVQHRLRSYPRSRCQILC